MPDDVVVVDTGNYYPQQRDGAIEAIEAIEALAKIQLIAGLQRLTPRPIAQANLGAVQFKTLAAVTMHKKIG